MIFSHRNSSSLLLLSTLLLILVSTSTALLSRNKIPTTKPVSKIAGTSPSQANGEQKKRKRKERVKKDEKVIFFPTAAHRAEDGTSWDIPIHGWIYEPDLGLSTSDLFRRAILTSLRKYIGLSRDDEATPILKRRVGSFLVDNERRKELSVQIGCDEDGECCRVFKLPKSSKNGHFHAVLNIDDSELAELPGATNPEKGILHFQAVMEKDDDRVFAGSAQMTPPRGYSVISDIDDTVKITGVGNKKKLLKSTFMEEFKQVPGMSELYQKWSEELDCRFHFVSSSPWQLWEELAQFLSDVGFPHATYHLKPIRIKDRTLFDLWKSPLETKIGVIESILEAFPDRKFLLVGDTGEKDPEVYGEIARRHPRQIKGIYVRNVTGETGEEERYDEAWSGVNREICVLFDEPTDIELRPEVIAEALELKKENAELDALRP